MNKIIESVADLERASGLRQRIEWSGASSELRPLSSAQLGIWFAQQIDPSSAAYSIGEYIDIHGRIDALLFDRALRNVVAESETLRVQIAEQAGAPAQFIDPARGSVLTQSLVLGALQIVISLSINALIATAAGTIAAFLGTRPAWMLVQRWLMGTVLAGCGCFCSFSVLSFSFSLVTFAANASDGSCRSAVSSWLR